MRNVDLRHLIYAPYFNKLLTDPKLQPFARDAEPDLANVIAGLIKQGQQDGSVPAAIDPSLEAALLVAIAEGLQGQVLLDQISPAAAVSLIDHQLDRLVPTAGNP